MGKIARFAPWLILGPVTGPLAAACFSDLRAGRYWRGAIWAALIAAFWIALPAIDVAAAKAAHLI